MDSLQEIWYTLKQNKLRSVLTAFGVFWGILMLILLLGSGQGMQNAMRESFSSDVRTSIWVWSSKTSIPYMGQKHGRKIQFTEEDLKAIEATKGLQYVVGEAGFRTARLVTYKRKSGNFDVLGVSKNYFNIKIYQDYHFGRRLNVFDGYEQRKVAAIGTKVAERLFSPGEDPVGKFIDVQGVNFRIIGVFYDSGWQGRMSERVYIPLSTYNKTFGKGINVNEIGMTPLPGYDGKKLVEDVEKLLKERHRVAPQDRKAIFFNNLAERTKQTEEMFQGVNFMIWFVGLGTLMAGIVGISNIMIITVKERTPEIGVRKALGATPKQIVSTIILEAVLITSVAGYSGLVLGVGILEFISFTLTTLKIDVPYFLNPSVDFQVAVSAVIILVVIGMVAGFIPAWKAARISPIEAMREHKN